MRRFISSTAVLFLVCCWVQSGHGTGQNITFTLSADSLPTPDDYTDADSFVKLYSYNGANSTNEEPTRFGTTKVIMDNKNPSWPNVFWFWYEPGTRQTWRFKVVDHDVLNYDDEIGYVDVDVDNFMNKTSGNLNVSLSNGGTIKIQRTSPLTFKLRATNLPPKDRTWRSIGLSDPYVECYYRVGRNTPEDRDVLFHTTAVIDDVESPIWEEVIEFSQYQMGADQYIHFKLYDDDLFSGDDSLGETPLIPADRLGKTEGSIEELLQRSNGRAKLTVELV